jgi:DNA processing protein
MGPRRLAALLDRRADPLATWQAVRAGTALHDPAVAAVVGPGAAARTSAAWRAAAARVDVAALWQRHAETGHLVLWRGSPEFPEALRDDREPPQVVFASTSPVAALDGPRVAIVGTRRCTRYGRDVARSLGHDLATAGVRVISGLALGIDGAAHEGALAAAANGAPPVGVVATGLDVVYPRRHAALWQRVAEAGLLLTEAPLGTAPERWRFPARNRIIAALADVVVVVESHATGGSLITAHEALERDRPVMAVPGPVRSPASAGTNRLLRDGLAPACDAADILVELGLHGEAVARGRMPTATPTPRAPGPAAAAATAVAAQPSDQSAPGTAAVLDALGWEPATLELLVERTGLPAAQVAVTLTRLETAGTVAAAGAWWERVS